jgi:hypothetical protein
MEKAVKVALSAIGIRLLLAPFFAHLWDVNTLQTAVYDLLHGLNPYAVMASESSGLTAQSGIFVGFQGYDYLPHAFLIFLPFYRLYLLLGGNPTPIQNVSDVTNQFANLVFSPDVNLFLLLLKLPIILADGAVTYLLARRDQGLGRIYAFSPYVILISSVWGNFDSIVALFLLMSILLAKEHPRLAGLFYGLSLMKLYTVILLPLFLVQMFRQRRTSGLLDFSLGLALSQVPTFYWLAVDSRPMVADLLFNAARTGGGITPLNTLWTISSLSFDQATSEVALLVFAAATVIALAVAVWRRFDLIDSSIMVFCVFLMFGLVVNEQYLLAVFPLLLLRSRRFAQKLGGIAFVFTMLNSTPVYFAVPLLYELGLAGFVSSFFNFIGAMDVFVFRSVILFSVGTYFFLSNFDVIRSVIAKGTGEARVCPEMVGPAG